MDYNDPSGKRARKFIVKLLKFLYHMNGIYNIIVGVYHLFFVFGILALRFPMFKRELFLVPTVRSS
jgi:hypothetical protein